MKLENRIRGIGRDLRDLFDSAVKGVLGQNMGHAEALKKTIRFEMEKINDFAREYDLPVRVGFNPKHTEHRSKDTAGVLVTVHQGRHAYPAERKIALEIDLTNVQTTFDGIGVMREFFYVECRKINPEFVPTLK